MSRHAMRSLTVLILTALPLLGWFAPRATASAISAPRYSVTNLSELPGLPKTGSMIPYDINSSGQVVGRWSVNGAPNRTWLYSEGKLIDTTDISSGHGINDSGQMTPRGYSAINNLGETTVLYDINDAGTTVSYVSVPLPEFNGETGTAQASIITRDGQTTILDLLPGAKSAAAYGINNKGDVVGGLATYSSHPFLFDGQGLHDLGTLGGGGGMAREINEKGQIVGWTTLADYDQFGRLGHAFLYENGAMLDLNDLVPKDLGWSLTDAYAINDSGMIIGRGSNGEAFLLTPDASPVPEPSTLVLFGGLLAAAAGCRLLGRRTS